MYLLGGLFPFLECNLCLTEGKVNNFLAHFIGLREEKFLLLVVVEIRQKEIEVHTLFYKQKKVRT